MQNLTANSHSYGQSWFHIVFCPKYRYDVLAGEIEKFVYEEFYQIAYKWKMQFRVVRINPDHVHMFVSLKSWQSPAFAMHKLKGSSANAVFKKFPWLKEKKYGEKRFWGGQFWSDGYFYRSVGSVTDDAVEFYIRVSQDKHLRDKFYTRVGARSKEAEDFQDPYVEFLKGAAKDSQASLNSFFTHKN